MKRSSTWSHQQMIHLRDTTARGRTFLATIIFLQQTYSDKIRSTQAAGVCDKRDQSHKSYYNPTSSVDFVFWNIVFNDTNTKRFMARDFQFIIEDHFEVPWVVLWALVKRLKVAVSQMSFGRHMNPPINVRVVATMDDTSQIDCSNIWHTQLRERDLIFSKHPKF